MTEEPKASETTAASEEKFQDVEQTQKMESMPPPTTSTTSITISESEIRNWCMFSHASALCGLISVPPIIGPLVIWLIKKNEIPQVDAHGKEAINFQLSIIIYAIISFVLCFILIGFLLLPILGIFWLVCTIVGAVKASNGELFKYPLTIRFLK